MRYCATCHQPDGSGVEGAFPSLHQTEWTEGDRGRLIRLVLYGMQGPIEVNGAVYNNVMTPHGFLTDEQVAGLKDMMIANIPMHRMGESEEVARTVLFLKSFLMAHTQFHYWLHVNLVERGQHGGGLLGLDQTTGNGLAQPAHRFTAR